MDDIDDANEEAEAQLQEIIAQRPKPQPIPPGNGRCWVCEITVTGGRRFCCRECADQWERGRA